MTNGAESMTPQQREDLAVAAVLALALLAYALASAAAYGWLF